LIHNLLLLPRIKKADLLCAKTRVARISLPLHSVVIVSLETENSISEEATASLIIWDVYFKRSAGKVLETSPSIRRLVASSQIQFPPRQRSESIPFV
jgi:hypothetical protein